MANRKSARTGNRQVVSENKATNMQEVIVHEVDANNKVVGSITRHIPITKERLCFPRKRPKNPNGSSIKAD